MSVFSKIGHFLKKALPIAAPLAGLAFPGVGSAIASTVGGLFSAKQAPQLPAQDDNVYQAPQQDNTYTSPAVNVTASRLPPDTPTNWGGMATAAIPLVAGAMNYAGMRQQNAANAQQAQNQMDFQAQQTGTSYQRGVADMKAAGLNPMLAYSQGGASSGGGAQAQIGNEMGPAANSALSAAQQLQQMEQTGAQTDYIQAQKRNTDMKTVNEGLQSQIYTNQGNAGKWDAQIRMEELNKAKLGNYLTNQIMNDTISSAKATASYQGSQAQSANLGLSKDRAYSDYYKDKGMMGGYYEPSRLAIQGTANSATKAIRDMVVPW